MTSMYFLVTIVTALYISIFFLLPIRKTSFKPIFKFGEGDFAGGAFVTLGHCLALPLFEIRLFDLSYTHTGGVAFIILLVQRNGSIVRHFLFIIFLRY